jgi:hypothetical protein
MKDVMKDLLNSFLFLTVFIVQIFLGSLISLSFQKMVTTRWLLPLESSLKRNLYLIYIFPFLLAGLFLARAPIYPWADLQNLKEGFPRLYFNPIFFAARTVLYLAVWWFLASRLRRGEKNSGAFSLVLILLTGTFWALDWVLSLDPHFKSTVFGLFFLISATLAGYGSAVFMLRSPPNPQALQDINNVHFTLIGTWLYLMFIQFQIIWSGNLPDEATWFVQRSHSSWKLIPWILIIFQCAIPLFSLLVIRWKASLKFTRFFGGWTFAMQILLTFWLILPFSHSEIFEVPLLSGLIGLGLLFFLFQLRRVA